MANRFDQFDVPESGKGNPFDQFDEQPLSDRFAEDFGSLPRVAPQPFSLMQERAVPPPSRGQSFSELSRDVTQRARNTAFGTGPGSVEGIPGAVLPLAAVGAETVASPFKSVVQKAATVGGAAALGYGADQLELPGWMHDLVKDYILA